MNSRDENEVSRDIDSEAKLREVELLQRVEIYENER